VTTVQLLDSGGLWW